MSFEESDYQTLEPLILDLQLHKFLEDLLETSYHAKWTHRISINHGI